MISPWSCSSRNKEAVRRDGLEITQGFWAPQCPVTVKGLRAGLLTKYSQGGKNLNLISAELLESQNKIVVELFQLSRCMD